MRQQTITLRNGFTLNARIWGPVGGIPVIGTHGWMDNAATFDNLAPLLPMLRLVSVDLPGHGFSGHLSSGAEYFPRNIPPYLLSVADVLGWEKFSIIGHSMGGVAGQFLAATYPERIHKLALLDIFGAYTSPQNTTVEQLRAYYDEYFGTYKSSSVYSSIEMAAKVRKSNGDLTLASAHVLAQGGLKSVDGGYVWAFDPCIRKRSDLYFTQEQLNEILRHIQAPTCVIIAEAGILSRMQNNDSRFSYLPDCQVYRVPGGHHVHLDDPEPVAQVLSQFFMQE